MPTSKHQLIFIHIPKCAGRSVAKAFGQPFSHRSIHEFTPRQRSSTLKFAVVRNPWSRFVSAYHYLLRTPFHQNGNILRSTEKQEPFAFADWLQRNLEVREEDIGHYNPIGVRETHNNLGSAYWFSSQLSWIGTPEGEIQVDRILQFSKLQHDIEKLCVELGVKIQLPHINSSNIRGNYRDYYDVNLRELVRQHYRQEIEQFAFSF